MSFTSVQRSQAELSSSVQFFHARRAGARVEHVVLLVPWRLVVKRQLALYIQV